jgi:hypothetical protein
LREADSRALRATDDGAKVEGGPLSVSGLAPAPRAPPDRFTWAGPSIPAATARFEQAEELAHI